MLIHAIKANLTDIIKLINIQDNRKKILFADDTTFKIISYFNVSELQTLGITSNVHINTLFDQMKNEESIKIPYCIIYFLSTDITIFNNPRIICTGNSFLITDKRINNDNKIYYIDIIPNIFDNNTFSCKTNCDDLFGDGLKTNYVNEIKTVDLVCDSLKISNKIITQFEDNLHPMSRILIEQGQNIQSKNNNNNTNAIITIQARSINVSHLFSHSLIHLSIVHNYLPNSLGTLQNNKYFKKYCYNSLNEANEIIKNAILPKFNTKYKMIIETEKTKTISRVLPQNIIKQINKYNKEKDMIKSYVDSIRNCVEVINSRSLTGLCYLEDKIINKTIDVNEFKKILLPNKNTYNELDIYCLVIIVLLYYEDCRYQVMIHKISKHTGIVITHEVLAKCLNISHKWKITNFQNNKLSSELLNNFLSFGLAKLHNIKEDARYVRSLKTYNKIHNDEPIKTGNVHIIYIDGNATINDVIYINILQKLYQQRIIFGAMSVISTSEYMKEIFYY
jgi:hypothetical protein